MLTGTDTEAQLIVPTEFVPPPAAINPAEAGEKVWGFRIGKYRVRHLKSTHAKGWGHDERDSVSRTLFSLDFIYEGDRRSAYRIIAGRHSIWFFN